MGTFTFKDEILRKSSLLTQNPRKVFVESFFNIMRNNDDLSKLLEIKCTNVHNHEKYIRRIAFTVFNISSKNYVTEINDQIHKSRVRKDPEQNPQEEKSGKKN